MTLHIWGSQRRGEGIAKKGWDAPIPAGEI